MSEISDADKKFIDESSYRTLLQKWRFGPMGDEIFQGETGKYYSKVMFAKKNALTHAEQVAASKSVGWDS